MERKQTLLATELTDSSRSAIRRYQEFVLGNYSFFSLLRYEVFTSFLGPMPGGAGLFLRKVFYRYLLKKVGRNVVFGRNVTIRHPSKIVIGDNCIIDDNCVLDAKGEKNRGILIGDNVLIGRNTIIACKEGSIEIGSNANIGTNCLIHSERDVRVGENTLIASYCYIVGGGTHDFEKLDVPIIQQGSDSKGIFLEDNLWLGAGVKVLDGVKIGRDSIIGAGAVVTKDIPELPFF